MTANFGFEVPVADDAYWNAVSDFYAFLPTMNDAGVSGYYIVSPQGIENDTSSAFAGGTLFFANQTDAQEARELFSPLLSTWEKGLGYPPELQFTHEPSMTSYFARVLNASDYTGAGSVLGSRLISRELLETPDGPDAVAQALRDLNAGPNDTILGNLVVGGQVARNADMVDNSINPAWRKALSHQLISRGWSEEQPPGVQKAVEDEVTNVQVPILKSLEPGDMGAYVNEADSHEPDFQQSLWGNKYERLYEIKQEWDPTGLFIVRLGVGSEDWDDVGFCRIN